MHELWGRADGPAQGAALAAIGSLGRRLLRPASDLDLVLLLDPAQIDAARAEQLATALWYPDLGLRQRRWTIRCAAPRNARRSPGRICGSRSPCWTCDRSPGRALVQDAATRVRTQWRREARRRVGELVDLAADRERRYGSLAHSSEPNLKSDRGGLRDVTVIRALAESWLADHDHAVVDAAATTLRDARDALQTVTGASGTRLAAGRPGSGRCADRARHR